MTGRVRWVLAGTALVFGSGVVASVWFSTKWDQWAAEQLGERLTALLAQGEVTVGQVAFEGFLRLVVSDVVVHASGRDVISAGRVSVDLDPAALWHRGLHVRSLTVEKLTVVATVGPGGELDLASLLPASAPNAEPWAGLGVDVCVDQVAIREVAVSVVGSPSIVVENGSVDGRFYSAGATVVAVLDGVSGGLVAPEIAPWTLAGAVVVDPAGTRLIETSAAADLRGFSAVVTAAGPLTNVVLGGHVSGTAGRADLKARVDASTATWSADVATERFDVSSVARLTTAVVLTGQLRLSGQDGAVDLQLRGASAEIDGEPVERIKADGVWSNGALTLTQATARGFVGDLQVSGRVHGDGSVAVHARCTLERTRLLRLGGPDVGADGTCVGDVQRTASGEIRVVGAASWPTIQLPTLLAGATSAAFDVEVVENTVTGTVRLNARAVVAGGAKVGRVTSPPLRLRVAAGQVDVGGAMTLVDLVAGPLVAVDPVYVKFEARSSERGVELDADARLGHLTVAGFEGHSGSVQIAALGNDVNARVTLNAESHPLFETVAQWHGADSTLELNGLVLAPSLRAVWKAPMPVRLIVADGGVTDAHVDLEGALGHITIDGDLGTLGRLDGRVVAHDLQLDVLSELWPESFDGWFGVANVELTLAGDAADPDVVGVVDIGGLWIPDAVRWLDVSGTVRRTAGVLTPDLEIGFAGAPVGRVSGAVPVVGAIDATAIDPEGRAAVLFDLFPGSFEQLNRALPSLPVMPEGSVSARVAVRGNVRDPELETSWVAEVVVPGWPEPGRVEGRWSRTPADGVRGFADARRGFESFVTVDAAAKDRLSEVFAAALGGLALPESSSWLGEVAGRVSGAQVDVQGLLAAASLDLPIVGALSGDVAWSGPAFTPRLRSSVRWTDGEVAGVPVDAATLAVESRSDGAYDLALATAFPDGGSFSVTGTSPDPFTGGAVDLDVSGTGIPLGLLALGDRAVHAAGGVVNLSGTVGGTLALPEPELVLAVVDGRLTYPPWGLAVDGLMVEAEVDRRRLRIERMTANTAPARRVSDADATALSRITAAGGVRRADDGTLAFGVNLGFDNAWVAGRPDLALRVDGNADVSGNWPSVTVRGDVVVVSGRVLMNTADAAAAPKELDARLHVVSAAPETVRPSVPVAAPVDLDVDLALDLGRNLQLVVGMPFVDDGGDVGAAVGRMDVTARLGGQVALTVDDGTPVLVGVVDVVGGHASLLRSRFELSEGTVTFAGGDPWEPDLDLAARMDLTGASVDLTIQGTPSAPDLSLTSEAYADPAMVMAMVLTGTRPDSLGTDQGAAAAGAVAGVLFDRVVGAASAGSASVDADGTVRVGFPVARSLYVQSVVAPNAGLGENSLTLEAEWALTQRLVLATGLGYPNSWTDLGWEIRF